jgi:hypothetical protein
MTESQIRPYDHYRPTAEATVTDGVYRVVGTDAETVVLVRVADASGRRENTGRIVTVSRETLTGTFASAANPDDGLAIRDVLAPIEAFPKALVYWARQLRP